MRDIKFRAWDQLTKQWICVGYAPLGEVTLFNMVDQWLSEHLEGKSSMLERLNDVEETQFTGLKDKNGKDVYHKDKLAFGKKVFVCAWQAEEARFILLPCLGNLYSWWFMDECNRMEIIGNDYEHDAQ